MHDEDKDKGLATLENDIQTIWEIAQRLGLDPYPTNFELVPAAIMYEFGAYGLPGRFSHWTFGKSYQQMKTMYDYGLSKIYELVVNTDPCYAFLMEANSPIQNKLVVAHVLAHSDFFRHNVYFSQTPRNMIEIASGNAERISKYEFRYGKLEVERFLDAVLSVQEHVDSSLIIKRPKGDGERGRQRRSSEAGRYDDLWRMDGPAPPEKPPRVRHVPEEPEKDLLLFVAEHAPDLAEWQRDIVEIVRQEMLYFLPQLRTKIMNEGWASFWHARIMRELELTDEEYAEFAALHANVLAPARHQMNPYHVGFKLFEDIERRWDARAGADAGEEGAATPLSREGRAKIFEVREVNDDVSFIRSYLTKELVHDLDLYMYKKEGDEWVVAENDWEKIRDAIVGGMTNFGNPYIMVEDGNYKGRGELYLRHYFEGQELDLDYAEKTLREVYTLWGRAVHLETMVAEKKTLLSFDGNENLRSDNDALFAA